MELVASIKRPTYAGVTPEFDHRADILYEDRLFQLDVVVVAEHEAGTLGVRLAVLERNAELLAGVDENLSERRKAPFRRSAHRASDNFVRT